MSSTFFTWLRSPAAREYFFSEYIYILFLLFFWHPSSRYTFLGTSMFIHHCQIQPLLTNLIIGSKLGSTSCRSSRPQKRWRTHLWDHDYSSSMLLVRSFTRDTRLLTYDIHIRMVFMRFGMKQIRPLSLLFSDTIVQQRGGFNRAITFFSPAI